MTKIATLLLLPTLSGCAFASAPWLNPIDAPANEQAAVAAGLAAIDETAPGDHTTIDYMTIDPDLTWVDQDWIIVEDGLGQSVRGSGMTWPGCRTVLVLDPDLGSDPDLGRTGLGHELVHCARMHAGLDIDRNHSDPAWWDRDWHGSINAAITAATVAE